MKVITADISQGKIRSETNITFHSFISVALNGRMDGT